MECHLRKFEDAHWKTTEQCGPHRVIWDGRVFLEGSQSATSNISPTPQHAGVLAVSVFVFLSCCLYHTNDVRAVRQCLQEMEANLKASCWTVLCRHRQLAAH